MKPKIVLLALCALVVFSCKKPDDPVENSTNKVDLEYPVYFGEPSLPSDNPLTKEGIKLGRFLFYEKMLSRDTTISCGSCHIQDNSFSDPNQFSDGLGGPTERNSMSLANLAWHKAFFWDGRTGSLEEQALIPIENHVEMNLRLLEAEQRLAASDIYPNMFFKAFGSSEITSEKIGKAIAQFERTMVSDGSRYDLYKAGKIDLTADELAGEKLFYTHPEPSVSLRGGNCSDCHGGALQQSGSFKNNGADPTHSDIGLELVTGLDGDKGKMKTVSLRNIAVTAPYMHDGRFTTLEEVLDHYNEHVDFDDTRVDVLIRGVSNNPLGSTLGLTENEKKQIIAFLNTLTDSTFIKDEQFSNPFE